MGTKFRKNLTSVSDLKIHLIFVTKYRRPILTAESLELIKTSLNRVAGKMGFVLEEFNGEADHIHMLIEYPPKLSISQIVNSLKGVSSRDFGKSGFAKPYGKDALWTPSYFVSSVGGAPVEVLKAYIRNQGKQS